MSASGEMFWAECRAASLEASLLRRHTRSDCTRPLGGIPPGLYHSRTEQIHYKFEKSRSIQAPAACSLAWRWVSRCWWVWLWVDTHYQHTSSLRGILPVFHHKWRDQLDYKFQRTRSNRPLLAC